MCGDHCFTAMPLYIFLGSPPHVRGPHRYVLNLNLACGITPACAGTTCTLYLLLKMVWDHPRMCGDHVYYVFKEPIDLWITPACAGTTRGGALRHSLLRDHPRMCGDHPRCSNLPTHHKGSPPHVRGPLGYRLFRLLQIGITPACAGTTIKDMAMKYVMGDHPRMCGDH